MQIASVPVTLNRGGILVALSLYISVALTVVVGGPYIALFTFIVLPGYTCIKSRSWPWTEKNFIRKMTLGQIVIILAASDIFCAATIFASSIGNKTLFTVSLSLQFVITAWLMSLVCGNVNP